MTAKVTPEDAVSGSNRPAVKRNHPNNWPLPRPAARNPMTGSRNRVTLGRTLGMQTQAVWYLYILRCRDNTLYTGIARDVKRRIRAHETGRGARYTRGRGPFVLCATKRCNSRAEASRLEFAVKQLSRPEKEALILPRRLATFARAFARKLATEP